MTATQAQRCEKCLGAPIVQPRFIFKLLAIFLHVSYACTPFLYLAGDKTKVAHAVSCMDALQHIHTHTHARASINCHRLCCIYVNTVLFLCSALARLFVGQRNRYRFDVQ